MKIGDVYHEIDSNDYYMITGRHHETFSIVYLDTMEEDDYSVEAGNLKILIETGKDILVSSPHERD